MGDDGKGEELFKLCDSRSEEPSLDEVKELVAAGANLDWKDDAGWTALFCTFGSGHARVVEYLVTVKGIDINTKAGDGMTALQVACYRKRVEVVEILIRAGVDINQKGEEGMTVIEHGYGNEEIKRLLREGAAGECSIHFYFHLFIFLLWSERGGRIRSDCFGLEECFSLWDVGIMRGECVFVNHCRRVRERVGGSLDWITNRR